jgi:translocation and assembly module TamB
VKRPRTLLIACAGAILSFILLAALAIRAGWLENLVRQRMISAIENASGERVAIQAIHISWPDLWIQLDGVAFRQPGAANRFPWLQADCVRVKPKISSVLKRDVDLASLIVIRPRVHLDGSVHELSKSIRLRVRHFEIREGEFEADVRRFSLNARGEDLYGAVVREAKQPTYEIALSAGHLQFASAGFQMDAALNLAAQLHNGQLVVSHLSLVSDQDSFSANGILHSFTHPAGDFAVHAHVRATDFARFTNGTGLEGGYFDLHANLHFDPQNPFRLTGKLSSRQVTLRWRNAFLKNVDLTSDVASQNDELCFSNVSLDALGGKVTGTAILRKASGWEGNFHLVRMRIRQAVRSLTKEPGDWTGIAEGHMHLIGIPSQFIVSADMQILPAPDAQPLAGHLQFMYRSRTGELAFGDSQLNLPHTQAIFAGSSAGVLHLAIQTESLDEVKPFFAFAPVLRAALPAGLQHTPLAFSGQIAHLRSDPQIQGDVTFRNLLWSGQDWGILQAHVQASRDALELMNIHASGAAVSASGGIRLTLTNWRARPQSLLTAKVHVLKLDVSKIAAYLPGQFDITSGIASGFVNLSGSLAEPLGAIQVSAKKITIGGQLLDSAEASLNLTTTQLGIQHARLSSGPASVALAGVYEHDPTQWINGIIRLKVDSNGFPLSAVSAFHFPLITAFGAELQIHGSIAARVLNGNLQPENADGVLILHNVTLHHVRLGSARIDAVTHGTAVSLTFSGNLEDAPITGSMQILATRGLPVRGALRIRRVSLDSLSVLIRPLQQPPSSGSLPVSGWASGGVDFDGALEDLQHLHALIHIDQLETRANPLVMHEGAKASAISFRNQGTLLIDVDNGVAKIRNFRLAGQNSGIAVLGSMPCAWDKPMDLTIGASLGLEFFSLLDPSVRASGQALLQASLHGTLSAPVFQGNLQIHQGSFLLDGFANGLSNVNGSVSFDRNRATIQNMTATSGGGTVQLGGFVTFGPGPLVYSLQALAENVRMRSQGNISVTADGRLQLSGTSINSVLSGDVSVSHIVLNANSDLGGLLAALSAPMPSAGNGSDFFRGLQLDVHIASAPNLQLTSFWGRDLQPDVDLRLRGTPSQPVLLGNISASRGEIKVFGTKYTINHADVYFANPVRIEPSFDLDLQTQAHGVAIDITIAGALNKLNINYRSDPPMQPRDIIALLAVGETPGTAANAVNAPTFAETAALQSSANTVFGQAISPNAGRLSKLFGITNVKIDPLAQGSTVTPESRLTIQQQISRNITVTYVTNLAQTSEQIFRLEWALSRQYSLVAVRDDNGEFGIDIQYKKRF